MLKIYLYNSKNNSPLRERLWMKEQARTRTGANHWVSKREKDSEHSVGIGAQRQMVGKCSVGDGSSLPMLQLFQWKANQFMVESGAQGGGVRGNWREDKNTWETGRIMDYTMQPGCRAAFRCLLRFHDHGCKVSPASAVVGFSPAMYSYGGKEVKQRRIGF